MATDTQRTKEKKVEPKEQLMRALRDLGGENWPHGIAATEQIDALIKQRIAEALEKLS